MKLVNYRTFLYTALNALAGVFLCLLFCLNKIAGCVLLAAAIAANTVLFAVFNKKIRYAVGFAVSAIVLICMLLSTLFITIDRYADLDYEQEHRVEGTIWSINYELTECQIALKNIFIDGNKEKGKVKLYIEISGQDKLEFAIEGDIIAFNGKIKKADFLNDSNINTFSTRDDIRYVCYPQSESINLKPTKGTTLSGFRNKLRTMLTDFMGFHYGNIAFSMLSGNKSGLETATLEYFSASGIGHILAVSGLHIGFLIALLAFIMKKVPAKIKVPIISVVLFTYALFAGFSASVTRALIMGLVGLLTLINGQRTDLLNNLALAFTLILAVSPFALFEVGFLMSISSILGIACFSNAIARTLRRIHIPDFLTSAVSVSVGAQLGITPCLLYFFHSLPLYSVILNVIILPIVMVAFVLLLTASLICLIISNSFLLLFPQSILIIIDAAARFTASLPLAQITLYSSGVVFLLLALYFLLSGYFMLTKFRRIFNAGIIACCAILVSLSVQTFTINDALIAVNGYKDVTSIVYKDDKVFIVGDCRNGKQIKRALSSRYVTALDGIYLTSMNEQTAETLVYLKNFRIKGNIYCPADRTDGGLITLADNDIFINLFDCNQTPPVFISQYGSNGFEGYTVQLAKQKQLLFLSHNSDYAKVSPSLLDKTAIIRCKAFTGYLPDRIFLTNFKIEAAEGNAKHLFSVYDLGEFIFDYSSGKIYN